MRLNRYREKIEYIIEALEDIPKKLERCLAKNSLSYKKS